MKREVKCTVHVQVQLFSWAIFFKRRVNQSHGVGVWCAAAATFCMEGLRGITRACARCCVSLCNHLSGDRQRCVCGCLVAKVCFPISVAFSCFTGKIGRTISLLTLCVSLVMWRLLRMSLCSMNFPAFLFRFLLKFFASFTMVIERPASRSRTVHRCIVFPWRNGSQAHAESATVPVARTAPGSCFQRQSAGRARADGSGACVGLRGHPGCGPGWVAKPKRSRANSNGSDKPAPCVRAWASRYGALIVPGFRTVRPRSQLTQPRLRGALYVYIKYQYTTARP